MHHLRQAADGNIADVGYFSILAQEWPEVLAGLLERLALEPQRTPHGFAGI
ncbi:hypothetical protein [Schaalia sp. JY-X159]|uniref:hypothetical protein n=1 Tax=Schaalia sp. JY-X159 TaxID=2758575 RepID=UPI00165E7123|nr:hypothetical protein [Schaalia sp. JY-X159]